MVFKNIILSAAAILATASASSKSDLFKLYSMGSEYAGPWSVKDSQNGTDVPVIGVVTQTLEAEMHNDTRFDNYKYYIMQSYVDWLQAWGARVVPLI